MLEGVGLTPEGIETSFGKAPYAEEEAVQSGLMKWRNGGEAVPTWALLIEAMEYAEIGKQHIWALKQALLKGQHTHYWHCLHLTQLSAISTLIVCY